MSIVLVMQKNVVESGQDSQIMVCLTVGTGIGGSLIIDHKLYNGTSFFAMEVGYMNVDGQCFEDIASTSALVRKVTALKNDGTIMMDDALSL